MSSPFAMRRWFDILFNRFGKRFPLVVHLNRCIIEWHILPLVSFSDPDILFTVLTEPQCTVGTNHLATEVWCAISKSNCYGNASKPVLVSNESCGRIITRLVMCARAPIDADTDAACDAITHVRRSTT